MAQTQTQSSSDNKFRMMEEEMNRFEAEIAHHQADATNEAVDVAATTNDIATVSATVTSAIPSVGYAAPVMGLSFAAPQPAVAVPNTYQPSLQAASAVINSGLFPTLTISPAQPMYMPPQMVAYQPMALLPPTNFYASSTGSVLSMPGNQQSAMRHTQHQRASSSAFTIDKTSSSSLARKPTSAGSGEAKSKATVTAATVIVAPPQMAGPTELAARAKETAAAAARFKASSSNNTTKKRAADEPTAGHQDDADIEVDDDVTRALLAAAAGVTYTRVQAPDGKTKTVATAAKTAPTVTPSLAGKPASTGNGLSATAGASSSAAGGSRQQKQTQPVAPLSQQQQSSLLPPTGLIPNQLMSVPPPNYRCVSTGTSTAGGNTSKEGKKGGKRFLRVAAGTVWEDPTLAEWDPNDFRIFCGDLGNEVSVDTLARAFNRYPSFQKAHVVRDKRTSKSRGYGFVSFSDPTDFARAMREMNGKYVGNRPIKLKRSDWRVRQLDSFKKKEKEKRKLGLKN